VDYTHITQYNENTTQTYTHIHAVHTYTSSDTRMHSHTHTHTLPRIPPRRVLNSRKANGLESLQEILDPNPEP
jgi:hypothetical protein